MKRILFYIFIFLMFLLNTGVVFAEPSKVMSVNYDDSAALVYLNVTRSADSEIKEIKYSRLENPNRIYFDIEDSVLIGEKQQLVFEKSNIKEIRVSQFTTSPFVVRTVITFEEGFDTTKVKLLNVNGNIVVKCSDLSLKNDYFTSIYDENPENNAYSSITVNSQAVQKVALPVNNEVKISDNNVMAEIQKAFENSTLANSDGKTYDSVISIDLSSDLKLRNKYYINGCYPKNGGVLLSGLGQLAVSKVFTLDNPKRIAVDLPNTFVDKKIRNTELKVCPDGSCKDVAKIGQFEFNKARLVITTDNPEKYIPVFSNDTQSLLFINADRLKHTDLVTSVSNLNKGFVRKVDSKTYELILSFTTPVVDSVLRDDKSLNLYLFNVKSYNELDLIKTLKGTYFKNFTLSLLPQIGVKATMPIDKSDIVKIDQSVDGRAVKITIKRAVEDTPIIIAAPVKKASNKGKVVLDAGHGGSDYGAIREGINEKDINLDVTQRVSAILKSKGYKVAMTRSDDTYVSLEDRVEFSENEAPEIFVSIHVNSAVATEPNGIETHYYHDYSKELANVVHSHMVKAIDSKDRGLFKSKFYVINHTTVPAILVEIGFLSNAEERASLITDSRKQKTAKAIAEGIIEYIKSQQSK